MIALRPQKMLVARTSIGRCIEDVTVPSPDFVRRCDDSNTPQFDRRPVGAISVLRGGLALELSPCAERSRQPSARLAEKTWSHPVTGRDVQFTAVTIERWYYTARRQRDDPVGALRRAVRKDCGKVSLAAALAERLHAPVPRPPALELPTALRQPRRLVKADPSLGPLPSYSTVKRYMQAHGLVRKPRLRPKRRPGEARAEARRQTREVRSYEAEYVGALWHLDFHHGSLKVLTPGGQWLRPIALGILDDHSRLCCHVQWYLSETAEDLVHGLSQAIQKRGLPRALLTDNGSAMVAEEVTEGLLRLGIVHERTLPYSPYQNGKQEAFWGTLEGRLMKMLDGVAELTLELLNEVTQAWVEIEYNRAVHRETASSPVERFAQRPTCCARALRASRCATRFAWKPRGVSVRATARSRSRGCGSRFRHGIATSAK